MKVCIVSHNGYGAISGSGGHVGGVERQTSLLACWLSAKGHDVSFITWNEGRETGEVFQGVRIIPVCKRNSGIPLFRFFYPRWSSLVSALQSADADIYYHNCGEYVTGQVALWCKKRNKKFIYSIASDPECDPNLPMMRSYRERILYRYGISSADAIITQTNKQKLLLKDGFGLMANKLPMPSPGPSEEEYEAHQKSIGDNKTVLWIGRIARVKNLEMLLDAAILLPEVVFNIAGGVDTDAEYAEQVITRAKTIENVNVLGEVSRDNINNLYKTASLLCCTSKYEGFPNTFLEAWGYGVPIVSTVDPDKTIKNKGVGIVVSDIGELVDAISFMNEDEEARLTYSATARKYYVDNHAFDVSMARFEKMFSNVCKE